MNNVQAGNYVDTINKAQRISVRVTDQRKSEFKKYADELGMTESALGAYVIGEFLRKKKQEQLG